MSKKKNAARKPLRRYKITRITEEVTYINAADEVDAEGFAEADAVFLDWTKVHTDFTARLACTSSVPPTLEQ